MYCNKLIYKVVYTFFLEKQKVKREREKESTMLLPEGSEFIATTEEIFERDNAFVLTYITVTTKQTEIYGIVS